MKFIKYTFILFSLAVFSQQKTNRAKKVVYIIVDGISYDQLKAANTPNLDNIANKGSISEAYVGGNANDYRKTPTISAVGYNSLLTGTWANKHNVFGNSIKKPNYNYPSLFRIYKDQNPNGKIAIFSSWLDNRTKLVGENLAQTNHIKFNYSFDGLEHDSINFPHDKYRNFMKLIDVNVALKASETILKHGPDLSWVYLEFTDDMGHAYGDSPQFNAAISFEDDLLGRIYNAVSQREKKYNEDWLFVVTTDHGRKASNGKGHGGQSARERSTWIVTNQKNTNTYFKEKTPAIVDIYPTILDFLNVQAPKNIKREIDGVSLLKPVDAINLSATIKNNKLMVSWEALNNKNIPAKLYITTTNHFNKGKDDDYKLLSEVDLGKETYKTSLKGLKSDFYKIVLQTPTTTLNYWITK